MSQPSLQAIAVHILPNTSQSKGNQTIKFGQLIEYNKRKNFLMLHSINWPNFIVWLSLLLEILGNVCITIVY